MSDHTVIELQRLVERAQGGDREAFGQIYEQLAPKIYGYIYHRLNGASEVAEDLTSGVFVKVVEKLGRYQDRGLPFTAWVYRLAHNHVVDHFRAQPKQGFSSIDDCDNLVEFRAEREIDEALTLNELTAALSHLTDDQRNVIVCRFLQGLSIAETAALTSKSEDAVKKLQERGLRSLRHVLKDAKPADLAA